MSKILKIDLEKIPPDLNILELIILYVYKQTGEYSGASIQKLNDLEDKKYLKWTDESIVLREKGLNVLELIEFENNDPVKKLIKTKDDIEEWIEEYRTLFQNTGPGKTADTKTLTKKMKWFYKEYPELADKELILKAAERYINTESLNAYRYLQRADYFISKEDTSKIKISRLASYCQDIMDEEEREEDNTLL